MIIFESMGSDIIIRGRDSQGKRYSERRKYRPYFYVPKEDGEFTGLKGEKLEKIYCNHPAEVKKAKEVYPKTFESDVTYINRYMIDQIPELPQEPIRCAFLDIEVYDLEGFPVIQSTSKKILSVSVYDSFKKKYHCFALQPVLQDEQIIKNDDINLYLFNDEKRMLEKFIDFYEVFDFDITWAWNGDAFDYPYLFRRMLLLDIEISRLSPIQSVDKYSGYPRGRVWLDLMWSYDKLMTSELESKSLDYVAKREGVGEKIKHEGRVADLHRDNFDLFIKYNIHDVRLMVEIERAKGILNYFDAVRRLTYSYWYDIRHNSRVLDFYFLKKAHEKKIVLPCSYYGYNHEPVEGARVLDPVGGLHEMVAAMDVRSLYPSAILVGNMSPETIDENGSIVIGPTRFRSDVRGFVPSVVGEMWDFRQSLKSKMKNYEVGTKEYNKYDELQTVAKFLLNSIYGVLLAPFFRLYRPEIGAAVTYFGRTFNHYMEDTVLGFKKEVVLGDTDSLYFKIDSIEEGLEISKKVNDGIAEFIEQNFGDSKYNIIYVEFEKIYKKLFIMVDTKKRYAGVIFWKGHLLPEPEMDIKGFDAKRSDSPEFIRTLQKDVLHDILYDIPKNQIISKIKELKDNILEGNYEPEKIAIPKGMSKLPHEYIKNIPAHVRGVIYSNMYLGTNIIRDKVKYIYVSSVPENLPDTHVISFLEKMPEGFEINNKRMAETLIDAKFESIFSNMGWEMTELEGISQIKGDQFW